MVYCFFGTYYVLSPKGRRHIDFGADPVGVAVNACLASCMHFILDSDQTDMDTSVGQEKQLMKFWWPWPEKLVCTLSHEPFHWFRPNLVGCIIRMGKRLYLMDRVKRIWYLSPMRAAKVQASLRIRAVSPEPPLLAHTSSESRETFRQKARSLVPLNGWACAVKICHDGMLEDTNSLDAAQIIMILILFLHVRPPHDLDFKKEPCRHSYLQKQLVDSNQPCMATSLRDG